MVLSQLQAEVVLIGSIFGRHHLWIGCRGAAGYGEIGTDRNVVHIGVDTAARELDCYRYNSDDPSYGQQRDHCYRKAVVLLSIDGFLEGLFLN